VIGPWFGTGPERGIALVFVVSGILGLVVTGLAMASRPYRQLSAAYVSAGGGPPTVFPPEPVADAPPLEPA
jgi:DHA3 family multidrug efflux protein-like MFS transporter